ncbi:hypothetical protein ACVWYQ_006240 [Bradyrhizobium sp. USDA 3397]
MPVRRRNTAWHFNLALAQSGQRPKVTRFQPGGAAPWGLRRWDLESAPEADSSRKSFVFVRGVDTLTVAEKVYSIAAFLAIVTTFLLVMSVQSVRLQTTYRHMHASSPAAAINVGRINALIYAIVMESRGIYMTADRAKMKQFADGLLRRNRELAEVVNSMEKNIGNEEAELFSSLRQRIQQFIEFRQELVRRGVEISSAAAREWGDNDANRTLPGSSNLTSLEAAAVIRRTPGALEQWRRDPNHPLKWRYVDGRPLCRVDAVPDYLAQCDKTTKTPQPHNAHGDARGARP